MTQLASHRATVALVTRYSFREMGGVETVAQAQSKRLHSNGYNVVNLFAFPARSRLNQLPILGDLWACIILRCKVIKLSFDVLIVNGAEYAWPFLTSRRLRTILIWHGIRSEVVRTYRASNVIPPVAYHILLSYNKLVEKIATHSTTHLAITDKVKEEMERLFPNIRQQVTVVYNDLGLPLGAAPEDRRRFSYSLTWIGAGSSLMSGRLKGLDVAIDTLKANRKQGLDLSLNVVGIAEPPPWLNYDGEASVRWLGQVPAEVVLAMLANSDALLLTSHYETMSTTALEALSVGCPVICRSAVAGWMIGDGGLVVGTGHHENFAAAVQSMYASGGPSRKDLDTRARAAYQSMLTRISEADSIADVVTRALQANDA